MVKTVYLHIGMNKTGSSAIQHYLSNNREQLAKGGLLYPKAGCEGNAHYGLSTLLNFSHSKPEPVDLQSSSINAFRRELNDEVRRHQARRLVFSSEMFVQLRPIECVYELFSDYDVKVVVYLRRHDKWWPSAYNQAVRTVVQPPWGRSFRAYLNFFEKKQPWVGDYRILVDRWAEVFGKENIILRPYEKQQNGTGLVHDFMESIGMCSLVEEIPPEPVCVNPSIGLHALVMVDACQRANIDPDIRAAIIHKVIAKQRESTITATLEPQLLMDLAMKYDVDYAYLAREYLGRDDGQLFYEPLPEVTGDWTRNKPLTLDVVVESVVSAMEMTSCNEMKALA